MKGTVKYTMMNKQFALRKNFRKLLRTIIEVLLLCTVGFVLVRSTVLSKKYEPFVSTGQTGEARANQVTNANQETNKGFIALSYFGVAIEGNETLISQANLDKHLQALRDAGYVTITQQDVLDYYQYGKELPDRALFLFFEDGRRESAILAQSLLEDCNFKASMLSYANNLDGLNNLFLSAKDLLALQQNGFWELGMNGYRLSYINVFDRHENYVGELTPEEYVRISPYVRREYNHYLMDYLRDEYDVPTESIEQMEERVADDYTLMQSVCEQKLGALPGLYTLMHSNTGQFATNDRVSIENERWMQNLFAMNFNREMYCYNDLEGDLYDLTRMQPQAYWSRNHLLMRIWGDTQEEMPFATGDPERAARWTVPKGAAEFDGDTIYLTSLPQDEGIARLSGSEGFGDFTLSTVLLGNKLGVQAVDLFVDESGQQGVAVEIHNNVLRVYNRAEGAIGEPLFSLDLDELDGVVYQTWEENRQEAMGVEIAAKRAQTYKAEESERIAKILTRKKGDTSHANCEPYVPEITLKDEARREMKITVKGGALTVAIDGKEAVRNMPIDPSLTGGIALRSAWYEYGYSQRNLADDVYDGVFQGLYITKPEGSEADALLLYENRLQPVEAAYQGVYSLWRKVINWLSKVN